MLWRSECQVSVCVWRFLMGKVFTEDKTFFISKVTSAGHIFWMRRQLIAFVLCTEGGRDVTFV